MPYPNANIIGKNLQTMRTAHGYSRAQLAKIIGVTYQQIQKYEAGQNNIPIETLYKLHKLFRAPLNQFFDNTNLNRPIPIDTSRENQLLTALRTMKNTVLQKKTLQILEILVS